MRPGFGEALQAAAIPFREDEGSIFYRDTRTAKPGNMSQIVQSFLVQGSWNEVVGTGWQFIFEDGVEQWDSVESDPESWLAVRSWSRLSKISVP
jgi:hypothetical protein